MKKFLRVFRTEEEYLEYTASTEFNLNSVSRCREGSLVFYDPADCGSQGIHRTISGETYCNGYDKYVYLYKQVSYDDGVTWETTATTSSLIEKDSEDCGYVPPTPPSDWDITAKFNVTSTSSTTRIANTTTGFSKIEIDGVEQPSVTTDYTFSTTGNHTVKYTLTGTSISNSTFSRCTSITNIVISDKVTHIGDMAFTSCSSITSVTIPNSVTSIGNGVFQECTSLTSIGPVGSGASIEIPSSLKGLNYGTFSRCTSITSVTIPDSVKYVGGLSYCTNLTSCTIGSGVKSIIDYAFQYCSGLTSIDIPSGVTSIGEYAFSGCSSLTSIVIPSGVTSIGIDTFRGCSSLTSIVIPSGVTSIGWSVFESCSGLTSITIQAITPPTLGFWTFDNTNSCPIYVPCESVYAYKAATNWSTYASRIQTVALYSIANAVVTCDSTTYNGSAQTAQNIVVTLSGETLVSGTDYTVTSNTGGTNAGSYNVSVSGINCYNGSATGTFVINRAESSLSFAVTNLTVGVGETKTNAVTVNAGDGTVTYSSNNTSIVTVDNNGNVTGISGGKTTVRANISSTNNYNGATTSYSANCPFVLTGVFNVTDTSNPTKIAYSTSEFSSIEIDGIAQPLVVSAYTFSTTGTHTVKYYLKNSSIGNNAFSNCTGLTSCTIGSGVTSIGQYAFYGCSSLTSITIPDSVTSIGMSAFQNCSGLTSIVIPDSVTSIYSSTFYRCSSLTSIVIPDSVTSIYSRTFYRCSSLTSCTIGNDVTYIDDGAFESCANLKRLNSNVDGVFNIPDSVTGIGQDAFSYCVSMANLVIGNGVTSIGSGAFQNCRGLTSIVIPSGVTTIGKDAFKYCASLPVENDIRYADTYAVAAMNNLSSYTIKNGTKWIGSNAFEKCTGLTSIDIPSSVIGIGYQAFYMCSGLTSIDIPDSVRSIGEAAFQYCSSLTRITSNAMTAPSINYRAFINVKTGGTLYVPIGSSGYDTWMSSSTFYLGYYNWTKVEQ